jgi:hypothetical protein
MGNNENKLTRDIQLDWNKKNYFRMMDLVKEGVKGSHIRKVKDEAIKELTKVKMYGEEGKLLSNRISSCGKGRLCQSIYCFNCSSNLSHKMFLRWIKQHDKGRVMYATTLLDGVCRIKDTDLKRWLSNFRRKMALCKKKYPDIFVSGFIEIEIIDVERMMDFKPGNLKEKKKIRVLTDSLKEYGVTSLLNDDRYFILPHFHGVVGKGELDKKRYTELFKEYFTGENAVYIRSVGYKGDKVGKGSQSIPVGLDTWSKYIFKLKTSRSNYRKDLYTFKTTFEADNPMPDETLFKNYRIPSHVISRVMMLNDRIKGMYNKGLIITVGK